MMKKRRVNTSGNLSLTFKEAREIVIKIKRMEGVSDSTIANYNKLFNDFERCFGGRKHINNVTVDDARRFIDWQLNEKVQFKNARFRGDKKTGVSVSSANTYLRLAKASFKMLVVEGILSENPFLKINAIKTKKMPTEILTELELRELLQSFDRSWYVGFRDYVIVNVMLDTFGRIKEICELQKDDIDYEKGTVTFTETKSGSYRIVPISRKVQKLIQELNYETEEFESPYIFISNHGTKMTPDSFRRNLRVKVKDTSITKRIHPHIFRHTAASMFIAEGGSIRALQKILGHSDITTTMIYAHMNDETLKDQHERFSPLQRIQDARKIKTRRRGQ